jgi:predicted amidophosphoribosyltransferase
MFKHLDTNKLANLYRDLVPEGSVLVSRGDICSNCEKPLLCHEQVCSSCGEEAKPSEPLS